MSSTPFAIMERSESSFSESVWGEVVNEEELTGDVSEDIGTIASPIVVDGEKLEIVSALLDVNRVYSFEYLGTQMVLWKLPSGAVDLFEIVG